MARPRVPGSAARQPLHELIARGISDSVNDPLEEMRGKNTGGKQKKKRRAKDLGTWLPNLTSLGTLSTQLLPCAVLHDVPEP